MAEAEAEAVVEEGILSISTLFVIIPARITTLEINVMEASLVTLEALLLEGAQVEAVVDLQGVQEMQVTLMQEAQVTQVTREAQALMLQGFVIRSLVVLQALQGTRAVPVMQGLLEMAAPAAAKAVWGQFILEVPQGVRHLDPQVLQEPQVILIPVPVLLMPEAPAETDIFNQALLVMEALEEQEEEVTLGLQELRAIRELQALQVPRLLTAAYL
jgi:hypothetical protein